MKRASGAVLVVLGAVLLVWAYDASRSVGAGVSRLVTGAPPNKVVWLTLAGAAALTAGLAGLKGGGS